MMDLSLISLIVLAVVVAIGFIKKSQYRLLFHWRRFSARFLWTDECQADCCRFFKFHVCDLGWGYLSVWDGLCQWDAQSFFQEGRRSCREADLLDSHLDVCAFCFHFSHWSWTYCCWNLDDDLCHLSCLRTQDQSHGNGPLCITGSQCGLCLCSFLDRHPCQESF